MRKRHLWFLVCGLGSVVCSLWLLGCPTRGQSGPTSTVQGVVVRAGGQGQAVAGVRLFAVAAGTGGDGVPVGAPGDTSASDGSYSISGAPVGDVDLLVLPADDAQLQDQTIRLTTQADATSEVTVRVLGTGVSVVSLTIDPSATVLASGAQRTFTAAVTTSDGSAAQPTWSTTGSVGTITAAGVFTAGAAGTGQVRATLGDKVTTAQVTVETCVIVDEAAWEQANCASAGAAPPIQVEADGTAQVIVGLGMGRGDGMAAIRAARGEVVRTLGIANAVAVRVPASSIEALRADPRVSYVEGDAEVHILQVQPSESLPWGVSIINAERVWGGVEGSLVVRPNAPAGQGVKVGIVDTGIDLNHPDLQVAGGTNIINPTASADDDHGHGTFAAGIIAALDNDIGYIGVAPRAEIYAVKVLNLDGNGRVSDVVAGIEWCVQNGMKVINLSLGLTSDSQTLHDACDAAWNGGSGALLVAASGNQPVDVHVAYPALYPSVMAVGATTDSDAIADFSTQGCSVELSAPGEDIVSTGKGGQYEIGSGTSFSAPHVSGVAALIFSTGRYSTAARVRQHIRDTAADLGEAGRDEAFGYGRADALTAVTNEGCSDILP